MQGISRKIAQAILYEAIAACCVAPTLSIAYHRDLAYSGALSLAIALIAMLWNMAFNATFEWWESTRADRTRTVWRRILHSTGFEGGLTLILVPLVSWWLNITWFDALVVDVGLFVFFFLYSFAFQWAFDSLFDVPNSANEA
ncbi:PACE efflux transporter [Paraburkholderia pallida]|uniref:PACE efflux transporter n=1 Tax=Paraburkholderia pallida TaxID=2547399 RepID=A0A4P7D480_9BURK|nr:PACE efflux transporter [Paraburkholderia pallida]QBR02147.1 PACE efflux transporter [Paraburkholderia pallida]